MYLLNIKIYWTQNSQVAACNSQQLLYSEQDPKNMEEIDDHRHIKTHERLPHLKATGKYPFCATRTDCTHDSSRTE